MIKKLITSEELRKIKNSIKRPIEDAMAELGWNRDKLAKEYGVHMRVGSYTKGRISQLINVHNSENSLDMLKWMLERKTK
jgi:hypothetical protein